MEWKRLVGNTGYILTGRAVIPTYHLSESELVLFDSGSRYSEEFLELLKGMRARVAAVFNTHLHSDHTAHNRFLEETYGAKIYAPAQEVAVLHSKERMTDAWGIASEAWRQEFLEAHPYKFHEIEPGTDHIDLGGHRFEVLALPGHTEQHTGYVTPDGVCYLGDALLSHGLIKFAKMPALLDEKAALRTMEYIKTMSYPFFILAHREIVPGSEIAGLAERNIRKEQGILKEIGSVISKDASMDENIDKVMEHFGIHMEDERGRMLTRSSVEKKIRAFLVDSFR